MRRRCSCLVIALALLGAGLWAGYWHAGKVVEQQIEREVVSRLPSLIGVSGGYKVNASAGVVSAARGRIESVRIEGKDVRLKSGIKLKRLDTTLKGIHVDPEKRTLTRIDEARFSALITGDELNGFLSRQYPDVPSHAELHEAYVTVTARPLVRGARVRVEADAALEIENGTRLVLRVRKVASGPITAPDVAQRYIEQHLNPVLDLTALGFKGRLTSITIHPDAIALSGEGEPGTLAKL